MTGATAMNTPRTRRCQAPQIPIIRSTITAVKSRPYFSRAGAAVAALLMMGCSPPAAAPRASSSTPLPPDMATYANIDAFVTKHLLLDLTADFEAKTLRGTAELQLERRDPRATEIVLDTRDLQIQKTETASGGGSWTATMFRLDPPTPAFGSALRMTLPVDAD